VAGDALRLDVKLYNDYTDIVDPFVLGKKNTPINNKQAKVMVGTNLLCADGGIGGGIDVWHYLAGGQIRLRRFRCRPAAAPS
jgi:hypothetical protein